jgi:hypothetical protein
MAQVIDKRTGESVEVDNASVVDYLKSGQYDIDMNSDIHVMDPNGGYGTIKASELAQAEQAGFHILSDQTVKQRELQSEYGDPLHQVGAFVEEGLDEVALGAGKALAVGVTEAVGGKQAAKDLRTHFDKMEEANPLATGAGWLAGNVGLAFATAGEGTAASTGIKAGLRGAAELTAKEAAKEGTESLLRKGIGYAGDALFAPGRALEASGGLAEKAVSRIVGEEAKGAFGQALQSGARMTARGATEGAVYGAVTEVSDAVRNDTPVTGEKLLVGIEHGALIGGVFGGALGFGGSMAASGIEKAAGSAGGMKELYAKVASKVSGTNEDTILRMMDDPDYKKVLMGGAKEAKDEAAKNIRHEMDSILEALDHVSEEAKGAAKYGNVRETVAMGNEAATVKGTQSILDNLKLEVRNMLADNEAYGEVAKLKELRGALNHAETQIEKAIIDGGEQVNAKLFWEIDNLKRAWGAEANIRGMMPPAGRDGATIRKIQGMYDNDIKPFLENSSLWGQAGENQAKVNKAWAGLIDSQKLAGHQLLANVGKDASLDNWRNIYRVDPAKLDRYLSGLIDPKADLTHEFVSKFTQQSKEFLTAVKEAYKIPEKKSPLIDKALQAADNLATETKKVEKVLTASNQINALKAAENDSLAAKALSLLNPVTGAVLGGGIGTAVATGLRAVATPFVTPGKAITAVVSMNSVLNKVTSNMDAGVMGFISKATSSASKRGLPAYMIREQVKADNRRIDKKNGVEPTPASIYAEKKDAMDRMRKNPAILVQRIESVTAPIQHAAPKAAESFKTTAIRANQFLNDKIPQPPSQKVGANTLNPIKWEPSKPELAKFARYAKAVDNPLSVIDDLSNGQMNREGVEALKAVYPEMHAELKQKFVNEISKQNQPLPYQARLQLSILLDIPADYTLEPAFIARTQESYHHNNNNQGANPSPKATSIDLSKRANAMKSLGDALGEGLA